MTNSEAVIQVRSETIRAPLERLPAEVELKGIIPVEQRKFESLSSSGANAGDRFWLKIKLDWYDYLLEQYERGGKFNTYEDLEIQAMRIGDIYLVGLPGEVFSRIGLEIKRRTREIGLGKVLVIALANGNPGYVPAEDDYVIAPPGKRGYELEGSYMLYGRPLVGPGTATLMIGTAIDLLKAIST